MSCFQRRRAHGAWDHGACTDPDSRSTEHGITEHGAWDHVVRSTHGPWDHGACTDPDSRSTEHGISRG
eukprot:2171417-Prymnesium_polylepis.1